MRVTLRHRSGRFTCVLTSIVLPERQLPSRDLRQVQRTSRERYTGMTSGLFLGNCAIVASLTLRCWATIAGGVRVIQSDSETSAKYGALNTSRNCKSVSPVFLM